MPKYKAHLAGGAATFTLILLICNKFNLINTTIKELLFYLSLCLVGSLFPDIDTKSKIQKFLYYPLFLLILGTILAKEWSYTLILSFIAFIPILANHRGLTHRIWFVLLIPLIIPITIFIYNKNLLNIAFFSYFFFIAGSLSHIILDFGPKRLFSVKKFFH